jgi:hypothetical protein
LGFRHGLMGVSRTGRPARRNSPAGVPPTLSLPLHDTAPLDFLAETKKTPTDTLFFRPSLRAAPKISPTFSGIVLGK